MPQTHICWVAGQLAVYSWTTGVHRAGHGRNPVFDIRDEKQVLAECRWLENHKEPEMADDLLERHLAAVAT